MIKKQETTKIWLNITHHIIRLKNSTFFKNVLIVMSGTAFAQLISFSLSPIISRLFSPSDFGIFGSFSAVSSVIAAGVTLDYSQAIMLPKEKEKAIHLFALSCLCTIAIGSLFLVFRFIFPAALKNIVKIESGLILGMLFISIIISGINQSTQAWAIRVKAFKRTSVSQVARSISSNGLRISFGFLKLGSLGLILSSIIGDMAASIALLKTVIKDLNEFKKHFNWAIIRQLAKEYRDFPMYSASQNVINALSNGLPVLLLTQFYGITVSGSFAFSTGILSTPMALILTALRQVLFQRASETRHFGEKLMPLYIKTTAGLFIVMLIPTILMMIWAPQLFSLIFGSKWHMAGVFARSLIIWLAVAACNLPAILFARIIRIQRFIFFYDLALLVARILTLVMGGLYLNANNTIMLFALVGAAMNTFLIFSVGRSVGKREGMISATDLLENLKKY